MGIPQAVAKNLTSDEIKGLRSPTIRKMVDLIRDNVGEGPSTKFDAADNLVPGTKTSTKTGKVTNVMKPAPDARYAPNVEIEAATEAGLVKSGWYTRASDAVSELFGPEAPRFAALLSATSPRQGVKQNMVMTLKLWSAWKAALKGDKKILTNSQLDKIAKKVSGASFNSRWPNAQRALQAPDGEKIILSGSKVNSFAKNLLGEFEEVTNDAWMAQILGVPQQILGTKAGYLAANVKMRQVAKKMGITPAEAQAAAWSFSKALSALRTGGRTGGQALKRMSQESVAALPEFFELLTKDPDVLQQLDRLGLSEAARSIAEQTDDYTKGFSGSVLDQASHPRVLKRVADRIGAATGGRGNKNVVDAALYQLGESGSAAGARGAVQFLENGKIIIHALEAKDMSTFLHEGAGHVFRRSLSKLDDDLLQKAEQAIGVVDRNWTDANEEHFARAFEAYNREGIAPTKALETVFTRFKKWLTSIYKSVTGSPLEDKLNPQLREVFDTMLGKERTHGLPKPVVDQLGETSKLFNSAKDTISSEVIEMGGSWRVMDPNNLIDPDTGQVAEGMFSSHFPRDVDMPQTDRHGRYLMEQGSEYAKAREHATRYVDSDTVELMSRSGADTADKIHDQFPQHLSKLYTTPRGKLVGKDGHAKDLAKFVKRFSGHGKKAKGNVSQNVLDDILRSGLKRQEDILERWGDELDANFTKGRGKNEVVVGKEGHAQDLARWASRGGVKFREPMETMSSYLNQGYRWKVTLNEFHRTITQNLDRSHSGNGQLVRDLFDDMGSELIDTDKAMRHLSKVAGISLGDLEHARVSNEVYEGIRSYIKTQHNAEWAPMIGGVMDAVNTWFKGAVTVATIPGTGIPMFPAFYARNFLSAQFMNVSSGMIQTPADIADYGKAVYQAFFDLKPAGQGVTGMGVESLSEISNPQLRKWFSELSHHKVIGHGYGYDFMQQNPFKEAIPIKLWGGKLGKDTADHVRKGLGQADEFGKVLREGPLSPGKGFGMPSPDDLLNDLPAPTMASRAKGGIASGVDYLRRQMHESYGRGGLINQHIEYINRAPMYIYLRKKGWSESAAAMQVKKMHFDYNDLSPFEQNVMKRVFPFYTFTRKMAGQTVEILAKHPGGMMRQTLRAGQYGNARPGTPDYIAEGLAIPMESETPGEDRYFSGFGMGHEDPLSFIAANKNRVFSSMLQKGTIEALSRMGPIPKTLLEWGTDETFFQKGPHGGRDLDDVEPLVARTLQNIEDEWFGGGKKTYKPSKKYKIGKFPEFVAANSGSVARILQMIRTLNDPRKSMAVSLMNTMTGLRITDVSPAAKDAILREQNNDIMEALNATSYTNTYFSKADKAQMSPADLKLAEAAEKRRNVLSSRGTRRKKEMKKEMKKIEDLLLDN